MVRISRPQRASPRSLRPSVSLEDRCLRCRRITVPLAVGDKVFCSYEIDAENAAFSWPSCADLAIYGAAAELGARLYTEGTQQWDLVKQYQDKSRGVFTVTEGGALSRARAGIWVPDELRTLRFWKEVDPLQSSSVGSVRRYRA